MADADTLPDLNIGSYVFEKSLQGLAKLLFLSWIVAWFLTRTSPTVLFNLPIAILLVFGLRWLSIQYDNRHTIRNDSQRTQKRYKGSPPSVDSSSCFGSGFSSPKTSIPAKVDNRWRDKVKAPLVEHAWETLAGSIIQEFIYDAWYTSLTPDREFPAETRRVLNVAFGEIAARARKLDLRPIIKDVCELLMENIELYRDTRDSIVQGTGLINFMDMTPTARERALKQEMKSENNLHPALATPDGHYKVIKAISEALAILVLDRQDSQRSLVLAFARELLGACVIRPMIMLCTPYTVNKLLLSTLQERVSDKQLDAEDMAAKPDVKPDLMKGHWEFEQRLRHSVQAEDNMLAHKAEKKKQRSLRQRSSLAPQQSAATPRAPVEVSAAANIAAPAAAAAAAPPVPAPAGSGVAATGNSESTAVEGSKGQDTSTPAAPPAARVVKNEPNAEPGVQNAAKSPPAKPPPAKPHPLAPDPQENSNGSDGWEEVTSSAPVSTTTTSAAAVVAGAATPPTAAAVAISIATATATAGPAPAGSSSSSSIAVSAPSPAASPNVTSRTLNSMAAAAKSMQQRVVKFVDEAASEEDPRRATSEADSSSDRGPNFEEGAGFVGRPWAKVVAADLNSEGSKDYVTYKIRVADDMGANKVEEWTVSRRFRNFETLHRRLRTIPWYKLKLPPKRVFFHSQNVDFVEERRDHLDKYLQSILADTALAGTKEVWEFLSKSSEVYELDIDDSFLSKVSSSMTDVKFSMRTKMQRMNEVIEDIDAKRKTSFASLSTLSKRFEVGNMDFNLMPTVLRSGGVRPQMKPMLQEGPASQRLPGEPTQEVKRPPRHNTAVEGAPSPFEETTRPMRRSISQDGLSSVSSNMKGGTAGLGPSSSDPVSFRSMRSDTGSHQADDAPSHLSSPTNPRPHAAASGPTQVARSQPQTMDSSQGQVSTARSPHAPTTQGLHMSRCQTMPAGVGPVSQTSRTQLPSGALSTSPTSLRPSMSTSSLIPGHGSGAERMQGRSVSEPDASRPLTPPGTSSESVMTPRRQARACSAPEASHVSALGVSAAVPDASPPSSSVSPRAALQGDGGHLDLNAYVAPKGGSTFGADSVQVVEKSSLRAVNTAAKQQEEDSFGPLTIDECTGLSAPLYEMVDVVFQLQVKGFFRQKVFNVARQCLSLVAGAAIDEALMKQLKLLRQEHSLARLIHRMQSSLWPGGRWFLTVQAAVQSADASVRHICTPENFLVSTARPPLDSDEISEAVKELFLTKAPSTLVTLLGKQAYVNGVTDLYEMVQSTTFIQQIGYGLMQVLFANLFPEMKTVFQQFER